MDKLLEVLTKVKEVLEKFKNEEFNSQYIVLVGLGIAGAVLDVYAMVDINDGFIVVLTALVLRLVGALQKKKEG